MFLIKVFWNFGDCKLSSCSFPVFDFLEHQQEILIKATFEELSLFIRFISHQHRLVEIAVEKLLSCFLALDVFFPFLMVAVH